MSEESGQSREEGGSERARPCAASRAVYDFATELMATRQVSDATLRAARRVLKGDRGVVDLVDTMGLYQLTAMMVRVDQTPLAAGVRAFFD